MMTKKHLLVMKLFLFFIFSLTSCAYKFNSKTRTLPGNFKKIHIPYFVNKTSEPIIETYFTNAMTQEIEKSQIATAVDLDSSEAMLVGELTDLEILTTLANKSGVPSDREIARQYQLTIKANYKLIQRQDNKVIWSTSISTSRSYVAPGVTISVLNSVNPLYNLSARRQNIETIAKEQTSEVFERLSENF